MSIIEIANARVKSLNNKGFGILDIDENIEIPYVIDGEEISYEHHEYRGKHNFILKEIIKKSEDRIEPKCQYYMACGGCNLQHLSEEKYYSYKNSILKNSFQNYLPEENIELIKPQKNFRRRLNLVFKKKGERLLFGFYKNKSNQIISIERCIVSEPIISSLILDIKEFLNHNLISEDNGEVFILLGENGVDIQIFIERSVASIQEFKKIHFIKKDPIISYSIFLNRNLVLKYSKEQAYVVFEDEKIPVDSSCFLQPVKESDKLIPEIIKSFLTKKKLRIADLFSGRGTYSVPLAKLGNKVDSFEIDKKSLEILSSLNLDIKANLRDLFYKPLTQEELLNYDVVVMNPPRTGAFEQSKNLVKSNVKEIIYISCSIETLLRDIEVLSNSYIVQKISGIDQFYWTSHMEIVVHLKRKS